MKRKLIAIVLCVAMLIPCVMTNVFADGDTGSGDSGNVLYYQRFGQDVDSENIVTDIESTGITLYDNDDDPNGDGVERHQVVVDSTSGFIKAGVTDSQDFVCLALPEGITDNVNNYTLEMTFRFTPTMSDHYKNTMFGFAWANKNVTFDNQTKTKNESNVEEFTIVAPTIIRESNNFDFAGYSEVQSEWNHGYTCGSGTNTSNGYDSNAYETKYGAWVTMKLCVKDNTLYGAYLSCNEKWWSSTEYTETVTVSGDLGIYISNGGADISSIRVVEGTTASVDAENGYKEYKGVYAYTSQNRYIDPAVNTLGMQSAKNGNDAVRFAAEIRGLNFDEAGFQVDITYKAANAEANAEATVVNDYKAVRYAYTSILGGETVYNPSYPDYYIIVIEITDIPQDAQALEITVTPYVKSGSDTTSSTPCTYTLPQANA